MVSLLKNWKGAVYFNGSKYNSINEAITTVGNGLEGICSIRLFPMTAKSKTDGGNKQIQTDTRQEYRITVKQYMTKQATPDFDFMEKWNNNEPMPLRTMTGWVEKETRGMVYMHLHGDLYAEKICNCMKCGKLLKNPVSQYFGIGPECGGHNYVNPFDNDEELKEAVEAYRKQLQDIEWEGWVIKSAIINQVEV